MWPFKSKRPKCKPPETQWPQCKDQLTWMLEQVAYYRSAYPKEAWHLFSPYWGSYMPINLEVGSSFDDNAQTLYRLVKKENDDLVQKAIANRPTDGYCYSISRVGDGADFDYNIRLLP